MILSSFNWSKLAYDYYETNQMENDLGGWNDLQGLGINYEGDPKSLGIDIEDALPDLPDDAEWVGEGVEALGRIVKPAHKLKKIPSPRQVSSRKKKLDNTKSLDKSKALQGLGEPLTRQKNIAPSANKTNEIPLVFFLIPLAAGAAVGYSAAKQTEEQASTVMYKLLIAAGGVAAGIAVGREYESYKKGC